MLEVIEPTAWPSPPESFSFSGLMALQECPRRWAYLRADYAPGGLASDRGRLIRRAGWGAIRGEIVHQALQQLLEIHGREGGPAPGAWDLVAFWSRHVPEGIPSLVARIALRIIRERTTDRRNGSLRPVMLRHAERESAALVASVNGKLTHALVAGHERRSSPDGPERRASGPRILRGGASPEVRLACHLSGSAGAFAWIGDVDVIEATADGVELIDYKTGEEKEAHRHQLEVYALLLARDHRFNPSRTLATTLCLVYEDGRCERWRAPDARRLKDLEEEFVRACRATVGAVAASPPPTSVGIACHVCDARPICEPYWASIAGGVSSTSNGRVDVQTTVTSIARDKSEMGAAFQGGSARVIVSDRLGASTWTFRPGEVVRILNARVATAPDLDGEFGSGQVFDIDPSAEAILRHSRAIE